MSLLAWFPLIKDGKNQGLNGTDLTLRGSVPFTEGKLGNAATFSQNAANSYHKAGGFKLADKFSWACWVKVITTSSTAAQFILSEGRDVGSIGLNLRCNQSGLLFVTSTAGTINIGTPAKDTWHHVIITVDSEDKIRTYLDGVESGTAINFTELDYAQTSDAFVIGKMSYGYGGATTYFPFCGQVQDVRIYDHVLSKKEIKELSKGLFLHVPLDWVAKPNLLNKSNNQFYFDYNNTSANTVLFWQSGTLVLESGVSYTISFDAKIDTSDNTMRQCLECDLYPDSLPQRNWYHNTDEAVSNQWKHFTWTTSSTVSAITSCSLRFFCDNTDSNVNLKVKAPIHVKNIKLEKGTVDTPYVPPVTSPDYTKYGFDKAYYQDCSGFKHVATITGTGMSCSTDAPRGTGTNWSAIGRIAYSDGMPCGTNPIFTINFWIKTKPNTTQTRYADVCLMTSQNNAGTTQSTRMELENTSGSNLLWHGINAQNLITSNAVTPGTWYMQTFVSDGSKVIAYRNGTQIGTFSYTGSSFIGWKTTGNIQLGDASYAVYYDLADFRVYATVLSVADIKELYSVSAQIDKSGKIYCNKFVEV